MSTPTGAARDADTTRLAAEALAAGDPTGWFEKLYAQSRAGNATVPWDRGAPNTRLVEWLEQAPLPAGSRVVVVGCGPGRDAEHVASLGFATTAFDVSPTAIDEARRRHPDSRVEYVVADLLALPGAWSRAFDVVVESHNVQALPPELHARAAAAVASLVAPGGQLRVLGFAPPHDQPADGPPWPLTRAEISGFAVDGVREVSVDAPPDENGTPRWAARFDRPADPA